MPISCVFCEIAFDRIKADNVLADPQTIAFLDHRPLFPGHVLLIPRDHHEQLTDLPPDLVGPFFRTARMLAQAVQTAMDADGTFLAINNGVSQSVPHLHVHIVPRKKGDGLKGFFWPRVKYRDAAHMEEVRARIAREVARLTGGGSAG
jgi:histidine triad (HIT) family protein